MPDKLTDNEIIKALEGMIQFADTVDRSVLDMVDVQTLKNALDLINRLQGENDRLSKLAELGNMRANDYRVMRDRALKAEAENERLTIRLRKVEHQLDDAMKMYNIIKAEAYKEVAKYVKAIIQFDVCLLESEEELICSEIDDFIKEKVQE